MPSQGRSRSPPIRQNDSDKYGDYQDQSTRSRREDSRSDRYSSYRSSSSRQDYSNRNGHDRSRHSSSYEDNNDSRNEDNQRHSDNTSSITNETGKDQVANSMESTKKRVPVSIEELIKKKNEQTNMAKPKFLTKEERAQLALERRQKEVEELRKRQAEERKKRENFDFQAEDDYRKQQDDERYKRRGNDRYQRSDRRRQRDPSPSPEPEELNDSLTEKEKQAIRDRYFGGDRRKRKIRKMNERKFVFDWDAGEDTSRDFNPLYANRHNAQMFGRGHIAGIDIKEQKKKQSEFYNTLLKERRTEEETERARELIELDHKREAKTKWDDRHWSDKSLEAMTERDWRIFKEDYSIATKGGSIPHPIRHWNESGLPKRVLDIIDRIGYKEPSPIQRQAIPIGMQNRDIIGVAETGSGKTASFIIPMLTYISELPKMTEENAMDGPYALILAPTRELAQQIEQEALKFAVPMGFTCVSIVGGHAITEQAFNMRNGAEIVIATPGRLTDCLDRRIIVLNQCAYVVMDEADRMIDMGFENDVNTILDALPVSNVKPDDETEQDKSNDNKVDEGDRKGMITTTTGDQKYRQTTMFSATMPPAVERLAKKYLRNPAVVTIGNAGQAGSTVEQRVEMIDDDGRKKNRLLEILGTNKYTPPIIIFVNQKKGVDILAKALNKLGYHAVTLHGGKSQEQREAALDKLKSGSAGVLVATDVAGRGIDVKNVSLVVNYDMAKSIEDYTHRIGRTGRAGQSGVAITFLSSYDTEVMYDLKQMLTKSPLSKVPPELARHEAAQTKPGTIKNQKRHDDEF
ncbi:P-loop containing nucleoside triphosphate hydrolase protein [Halteromyces radiatus]|uniref:P-loop containing nucleoside triphosphate hydrolase protein n=1 Tax=Halteromyces radiatus TaxID=101107 RepID=UPI00221E5598|nr:P-loop containing nucleoside triphosphate hydrolase protein [Halteromyces radiatus]KAI8097125.1 P-loop containing nucleoside triphosphate hydrolase protein [Halteromyces radiatus]